MLRTNLATRPFYNERIVHAVLGVVAVTLVVASGVNVREVLRLTGERREFAALVAGSESRMRRATEATARHRARIDPARYAELAKVVDEANAAIALRTFSWTALINDVESSLPSGVTLMALNPLTTDAGLVVNLTVTSDAVKSVEDLMSRLEATGRFTGVLSTAEQLEDQGAYRATVRATYTAAGVSETGGEP